MKRRQIKINEYSGKTFYQAGGWICLVSVIIFFSYLMVMSKNLLVSSVAMTSLNHHVLMLLVILLTVFSIKNERIYRLYILLLFVFFIWFSFADTKYSPIDECANFDYINCIIKHHRLLTFHDSLDYNFLNDANDGINAVGPTANYEAVQAPLFYLLFAFVGRWFDNAFIRFHVLRILSLSMILATYGFLKNCILFLKEHSLSVSEKTCRILMLLTVFNPAYLYRASRLNNEVLVCVLMAVLLNVSIKCIMTGYDIKKYWLMAFICCACFMTKSTAIYAYLVFGIVVIFQKHLRHAILPAICSFCAALPWFLFNYRTYHSLTAMKQHMDFVMPIVNPDYLPVDLFESFFSILAGTYFTGEEVAFSAGEQLWTGGCFLLVCFVTGHIFIELVAAFRQNGQNFSSYEPRVKINGICLCLLFGGCAVLTVGTVLTKIDSVRGRYFYGPCAAVLFLFLLNEQILFSKKDIKKYCYAFLVIVIGIVVTRDVTTFLNRFYEDNHLYGSNIQTIKLCDLNNADWLHGYARNGNTLLVQITDENKTANYKALIGHSVSDGMNTAVLTDVSEPFEENSGKYIHLTASSHLDGANAETAVLNVGRYCSVEDYNSEDSNGIYEEVEGKEFTQSMVMKKSGDLCGFSGFFGTYFVSDYRADVTYTVKDEQGDVLQNGILMTTGMSDNSFYTFYFAEPIHVSREQKLSISIKCDSKEDAPLALRITTNDSYVDGAFGINGNEKTGEDAVFKLIIQD